MSSKKFFIYCFYNLVQIQSPPKYSFRLMTLSPLDHETNELKGVCVPQSKMVWLGSDLSR
jgi:hypothetical protein